MSISLKELKKNRLTPTERFVLEQIEGAKPQTLPSGKVYWYDKDEEFLFEQNFINGYLVVGNVWGVLGKDFGLNYDEIKELLTNLLYDYTNNGKLKVC